MEKVKLKRGNKVSIHWGRDYHGYDSHNGYYIPDHGLVECLGAIKNSLYLFYKYSYGRGYWFLYDSKHNIMFFETSFFIISNRTGYKVKLVTCDEDGGLDDFIKIPKSKLVKFLKTHSWELSSEKTDCWFKPHIELSSEVDKDDCYTPEEGSEYNIVGPHTNYACMPFNYPEPIETPSNKIALQDDEFEIMMQAKLDKQKELNDQYMDSLRRRSYGPRETHISDTALRLAKAGGVSGTIAALGIATF